MEPRIQYTKTSDGHAADAGRNRSGIIRRAPMISPTTITMTRPMTARSNAVMSPAWAFENMRTAASK